MSARSQRAAALREVCRLWGHEEPGCVPQSMEVREVWPELAGALDDLLNPLCPVCDGKGCPDCQDVSGLDRARREFDEWLKARGLS